MKKRLLYLFFTVFICSLGFAENIAWFAPYAAGFNVDLNNTEMYSGAVPDNDGHGRLPQVYFNQNAYNDDTLIAVAGFKTTNLTDHWIGDDDQATVTFKVSLDFKGDTSWTYASASEPYLKRPFGLDFVICYNDSDARDIISVRPSQDGGDPTVASSIKDQSSYSVENGVVTFKATITAGEQDEDAVWVDIVLVLPDDSKCDMSSALSADDYYCGIKMDISVTGDTTYSDSWTYSFNGFISDDPNASVTNVFFTVLPNATANSIAVNNQDFQYTGNGVSIGTYEYETQSFLRRNEDDGKMEYDIQKQNEYHIFASSSADPLINGGVFTLVLNGLEADSDLEDSYMIKYLVGLESTYPNNKNGGIVWFDGQAHLRSSVEGTYQKNSNTDYTIIGKEDTYNRVNSSGNMNTLVTATEITENMRDNMINLVYRDSGNIKIKAADPSFKPENLTAGIYTSTIYFHIISDF